MIVMGYPTTEAAIDSFERSWEREWEQLNAPDPAERQMKEAAVEIEKGLKKINDGLDALADAMISLTDTPMQYKVGSCIEGIESLVSELGILKEHYERGER